MEKTFKSFIILVILVFICNIIILSPIVYQVTNKILPTYNTQTNKPTHLGIILHNIVVGAIVSFIVIYEEQRLFSIKFSS